MHRKEKWGGEVIKKKSVQQGGVGSKVRVVQLYIMHRKKKRGGEVIKKNLHIQEVLVVKCA